MAKYNRNRRMIGKGKKKLPKRRWFRNVGNPNEKGKDPRDNPNNKLG